MVLKNNSESNKESSSKKGSDEAAKQREIEEAKRRKEAEERRREALLLEAKKKEAIEAEKRDAEKRREQQIKVEPITVRNADGSFVVKDDHGRLVESKDAKGETRKFGYNGKGELNSFSENGKEWTSKDGQTWQSENEKPRTLRAVVNSEDGTFAKVEINAQSLALKTEKTTKTANGSSTEAVDANGVARTFGYNDKKELISFTDEKGKQWDSTDGQVWKADGQPDKALKVSVNTDGSSLTIAEANTQFDFVNGNLLTKNNSGSELRDKNNVVLESSANLVAVDNKSDSSNTTDVKPLEKEVERPALTVEQKQEQIKQAAAIIHENSDDIKKVADILEPMTEAERLQLKEAYKNTYNVELQDDLFANLSKPDAAQCEAVLKRKDGVADNSGQIHQALAKLEVLAPSEYAIYSGQEMPFTDGQVRAEKEIRDSISALTAAQFTEVKNKYQNDYGRDLESDLLNDKNLSLQSKEALKIYFKGSDARSDEDTLNLADYALKQHRPDIFNDVFRDATPAARAQFKNADGYKRIDAAYVDENGNINTADAQISKDFLDRGSVSIATLTAGNTHWYHTNREDISRSMINASDQDRKDFVRGEQLKANNETPKTAEDERALNYYNTVDTALHGAGGNREVAIWQAQLRNHGTFISEALSSRYEGFWFTGFGASTDKNKLIGSVENLSKSDWQYLKAHPEELKTIDNALGTFEDNHREQVMTMLQKKVGADSFEQSQTIGNRDIEERLKDSRDSKSRMDAIEGMSQEERQRYLNNQDGLKERLDQLFAPGGDRERYILNAVAHETPGQTDAVTRVLIDGYKGGVQPAIQISHIEEAFRADPTLRQRLTNPQTEEDKQLNDWFHRAVDDAVINAGLGPRYTKKDDLLIAGSDKQLNDFNKMIFEDGQVPLEKKVLLTSDKVDRINVILHASPDDQARLLNPNPDAATKLFQDTVLGTTAEREVTLYALTQRDQNGKNTNGELSDADRFRLFALGDKVEQDSLRDKLSKMTPEQRQQLADEYYTKYHRLITSDVIGKVKEDDKWRFRELLSPTDISVRQIALDSQRALNSHTSDFDPFLKSFWDYSRVSADASQDKLNQFVAEHAKELEKLTPEQRKQFDDAVNNFSEAQRNYINSKGEFAEAFVNATITIAAIGGALFTGGTSLTLLTAVGAGGALYRIAMMKAIQGSDFDSSAKNIFKQGFEGGTAAMLSLLGPEQFGLKGLMVGEELAGQTARKLLTDAATAKLFKEGSEEVLVTTLAKISREGAMVGEKEITALADKLAANCVDRSLVENAIRSQLKNDVTTGVRNKLLNEAESYAKNMAAAQFGSGGKEILATAVGLEDPKTLLDRLGNSAVSTAGGVTMFHFTFRALAGGTKMIGSLGRDGESLVAGEGTVIRHSDGSTEIVAAKKLVKLRDGDKICGLTESETLDLTDLKTTPMRRISKLEDLRSQTNLQEDDLFIESIRAKYPEHYVGSESNSTYQVKRSSEQTEQFTLTRRLDEKFEDGTQIYGITVAKKDPLISDLMMFAKLKYGSLPPELRAEAYTRFAKRAFHRTSSWSEQELGFATDNLRRMNYGRYNTLGEYAQLNSGVCLEQAMFLKLLGDQHNDWKVSLVAGNSAGTNKAFAQKPGQELPFNHAWTEFRIDGKEPKVYDPRQEFFGPSYDEMAKTMPLAHVPADQILIEGMPDAVKVKSEGDDLYEFRGFDTETGKAIIYKPGRGDDSASPIYFESPEDLTKQGWKKTSKDVYVKDGVACFAEILNNGQLGLIKTNRLRLVDSKTLVPQRGKRPEGYWDYDKLFL